MSHAKRPKFDEIGYWSEIKLDIVKNYAVAYSRILSAQKNPSLEHVYVDAFAGPEGHVSRRTGQFIPGSPLNALLIGPPFCAYHLIDIDGQKVFVNAWSRWPTSSMSRNRYRCAIPRAQRCITCSLLHKSPSQGKSSTTFSRSTGNGESCNGGQIIHRMDRGDVESSDRLLKGKRGL